MLHFVEHNEPVAVAREKEFGLGDRRAVRLALHVEHHRTGVARCHRLGQRGLAHPARAEQRHRGELEQSTLNKGLSLAF